MKFGNYATFEFSHFWEKVNMRLAVLLFCFAEVKSFLSSPTQSSFLSQPVSSVNLCLSSIKYIQSS